MFELNVDLIMQRPPAATEYSDATPRSPLRLTVHWTRTRDRRLAPFFFLLTDGHWEYAQGGLTHPKGKMCYDPAYTLRQGIAHRIRGGLAILVAISITIVLAGCGSSTASAGPACAR
jgi:hypothetical protein